MSDGPDFAIYKSTHRDVLKAYEDTVKAHKEYNARLTAQIKAWGLPEGTRILRSATAWHPSELLAIEWYKPPPAGWRKDGKHGGRIVPYRKEKKLAAEWDALRIIPDLRRALVPYGMPVKMFGGSFVTSYALTPYTPPHPFADPEIWVKWHEVDPLASDQWWTKVKLSEYYKMVEDGNDPFATKADEEDPDGA